MSAGDEIIEARDVWRVYKTGSGPDVTAVQGVNLRLDAGKFYVLKGRSGSGKTTLLNLIGGLDEPTRGAVFSRGREISSLSAGEKAKWRRSEVGFIFQSFGLLPTLSAYENVEIVPRISGDKAGVGRKAALDVLDLVGLRKWKDHRPYELSGGQQQRVAIARALVRQPRIIIADEPTGELDTGTAREILELFKAIIVRSGVTLLVATHDVLVDSYADQVFELVDGVLSGA